MILGLAAWRWLTPGNGRSLPLQEGAVIAGAGDPVWDCARAVWRGGTGDYYLIAGHGYSLEESLFETASAMSTVELGFPLG